MFTTNDHSPNAGVQIIWKIRYVSLAMCSSGLIIEKKIKLVYDYE